jgi:DNA-binding beta-propeller fold protein YncE
VVFDRDPVVGTLTYRQTLHDGAGGVTGLDGPWDVAVSPDGDNVYAAAADSNSVAVFDRNPGTGELVFSEAQVEGLASVVGLMGPVDLAVSPCGRYVLVIARGSLVVFRRDPASGLLSFLEADFDGEGGVSGIPMPYDLVLCADGSDAVYGSYESMAVFTARSFADGFESGGTGQWSTTAP